MQPPPVPRLPTSGKLISIARVYVKLDKVTRMRQLLRAIKTEAEDVEEGTLTYRVTESLGNRE